MFEGPYLKETVDKYRQRVSSFRICLGNIRFSIGFPCPQVWLGLGGNPWIRHLNKLFYLHCVGCMLLLFFKLSNGGFFQDWRTHISSLPNFLRLASGHLDEGRSVYIQYTEQSTYKCYTVSWCFVVEHTNLLRFHKEARSFTSHSSETNKC